MFQTAFEDMKRVREIANVMTRHGLREVARFFGFDSPEHDTVEVVHDKTLAVNDSPRHMARRLRLVMEDLGSTAIKLGQILSTRPDLLPPDYIREFKKLQDMAPTVTFEKVKLQVETSLGRPLDEMYATFNEEPLATASMAQVHRATLEDGREVVVKVQRPEIDRQIKSDMVVLYYLARMAEATIDEVGLYNPVAMVKEFETAITEELNFLIEAQNTKIARHNSAELKDVVIPEVIEEFTSARVITQTYIQGNKLEELEVGSERAQRLCTVAMNAAFGQIFRDGFFHGDPHPGNMLITNDDQVVFLDWGLVGRLSAVQRDYLVELLFALVTNDIDGITRMILRMGSPEGRVSLRALKEEVETLYGRYLVAEGSLETIDITAMMEDVMAMAHDYRIRINPQYALLTKAIATVEGVLRSVYPSLDVMETLRPFGQELMLERLSGERVGRALLTSALSANNLLRELPLQIDQILMDVEGGEWRVHVAHPQLDQFSQAMTILGSRIFMGFLAGALIIGGCVLLTSFDWRVRGVPMLLVFATVCFLAAGGFAFAALSWHFVTGGLKKLRLTPWLKFLRGR